MGLEGKGGKRPLQTATPCSPPHFSLRHPLLTSWDGGGGSGQFGGEIWERRRRRRRISLCAKRGLFFRHLRWWPRQKGKDIGIRLFLGNRGSASLSRDRDRNLSGKRKWVDLQGGERENPITQKTRSGLTAKGKGENKLQIRCCHLFPPELKSKTGNYPDVAAKKYRFVFSPIPFSPACRSKRSQDGIWTLDPSPSFLPPFSVRLGTEEEEEEEEEGEGGGGGGEPAVPLGNSHKT